MKHELDLSTAAPKQRISGQYHSSKALPAKSAGKGAHRKAALTPLRLAGGLAFTWFLLFSP